MYTENRSRNLFITIRHLITNPNSFLIEKNKLFFLVMAFTIYMPRFLQYFMFIEMSEITKFITYQAIFTLPMVVLFSSLSDQMRKTISTPKVRKGFYIVPAMIFVAGKLS